MRRSLMWLWVRPNSAVNTREVCPRLGAWDVTARPWRTSINSKSPPKGRYVHSIGFCIFPIPEVPVTQG